MDFTWQYGEYLTFNEAGRQQQILIIKQNFFRLENYNGNARKSPAS